MESASLGPRRVILPATEWPTPDFKELWAHRDLVYFLARRDVALRYKQSVIGTFWAVLQPVLLAAVFSVFLGLLAKVPSESGIPYPLFAVSGLVMWLFISQGIIKATTSTVESSDMISKIYFPRLAIPLAAVMPSTVDFLVSFVVVVLVSLGYGFVPGPQILLIPTVLLLALTCTLGTGLWAAALNAKYRDIQHLVSFGLLLGLFIAPIVYPLSQVPENLQVIYALNPVVGVLEAYRWVLLGTNPELISIAMSVVISTALLITGVIYFRRAEQSFADVL
jgi:lipopolysaccharide transport system permease protein